TGGGSGIGLGIARAMADEGCRVALTGRNQQRLDEAAATFDAGSGIATRPCDVADRADVGRLADWFEQQWGTPDVLVNSAGINVARRSIADLDPAEFDRIMAVNNTGTFNCIHAVLPGMRSRGSGLIVNISSIAGKRAMKLGGVGYCASKFAVSALCTTIGLEERDNGIHVTNVYPGEVDTPILQHRPEPVPPEKLARMLQPEDVAACVVTIAKLPARALVPELVITPLYQEYS
ncbi:MAG: SDR family oxidoreductase, partial [Candidatus Nealsonbacteria bacterium]|nr:SDR family oxidoreductase [Candidatus Nealsonbacteria bacterium]